MTDPEHQVSKLADLARRAPEDEDGFSGIAIWVFGLFVGMIVGAGIMHMLHMAFR